MRGDGRCRHGGPTSRQTWGHCCHSSRRCSRVIRISRSGVASPAALASVRGPKCELRSRSDDAILRTTPALRFSDAQCGFKAARRAVAVLSRFLAVGVISTLAWSKSHASSHIPSSATPLRSSTELTTPTRAGRLADPQPADVIVYSPLSGPLGAGSANAVALSITALANTATHRRVTFGERGRRHVLRRRTRGRIVFAVALSLSSGALACSTPSTTARRPGSRSRSRSPPTSPPRSRDCRHEDRGLPARSAGPPTRAAPDRAC